MTELTQGNGGEMQSEEKELLYTVQGESKFTVVSMQNSLFL